MSKDVTGSESLYRVRSIKNKIAMVLSCGATAFGLLWLVWILLTTIIKGIDALNLQLFTGMTRHLAPRVAWPTRSTAAC